MCDPLTAAVAGVGLIGGLAISSASQPKLPSVPDVAPTPPAPPPPPQEAQEAQAAQRPQTPERIRADNSRQGPRSGPQASSSSTLLTGPAGVTEPLDLKKNTLLGM